MSEPSKNRPDLPQRQESTRRTETNRSHRSFARERILRKRIAALTRCSVR